jgi:phosphoserine phosphatase
MNVYDFDDTIYSGDSTLDFYKYCLKSYPKVYLALPNAVTAFALYKLGMIGKILFKQRFFSFLKYMSDIDGAVSAFWSKYERNIKPWYLAQKCDSDIIISASPEFLLAPVCQQLGVKMIASRVDKHTGVFTGENCFGAEKVKRLETEIDLSEIEAFYSDSLSDKPVAQLAKSAYMVRKNKITEWDVKNG